MKYCFTWFGIILASAAFSQAVDHSYSNLAKLFHQSEILSQKIKKYRVSLDSVDYKHASQQIDTISINLDTLLDRYTTSKKNRILKQFHKVNEAFLSAPLLDNTTHEWSLITLNELRFFQEELLQFPALKAYLTSNDTLVHFNNPDWLNFYFKKQHISYENGKFLLNILTVQNLDTVPKTFQLVYYIPSNFQTINKPLELVTVTPGGIKNIAIRMQGVLKNVSAKTKYNVVASLKDTSTNQKIAESHFSISPQKISNWQAHLANDKAFFTIGSNSVLFSLHISNKGTSDEWIKFDYVENNQLKIKNKIDSVLVTPGVDSILVHELKLPPGYHHKIKQYTVGIRLSTNNKSYTFTQNLIPVGNKLKLNPTAYRTFDGYIELNTQNINRTNKQFFLNSQASMALNKNRTLYYSYRQNYLSSNFGQQSGTLFNVVYRSKKFRLNIGDQNELYNTIVNGFGFKSLYNFDNEDKIEAVAVRSRDSKLYTSGLKYERKMNRNWVSMTQLENKQNTETGYNHSIYKNLFSWKENDSLIANIELGYGSQHFSPDSSEVYVGVNGAHFATEIEWLAKESKGGLMINLSSNNFPGFTQGVKSVNLNHMFKKKSYFIGPRFRVLNSQIQTFTIDSIRLGGQFITQDYEIDIQRRIKSFFTTISPGYVIEKQDSILSTVNKIKWNVSTQLKHFKLNLLTYIGMVNYPQYHVNSTRRININLSTNYKGFGLNLRARFGPFYSTESINYIQKGTLNQTLAILPFFNWYAKNDKLWVTTTAEITKENNQWSFQYRNSLKLNFSKDMSFQLFTSSFVVDKKLAQPFINVGVKKNISAPVPFARKFSSLKMHLYKDENNNGIYDKDIDSPIANATIKLGNYFLKTDTIGKSYLKNILPDIYDLDLSLIPNMQGWVCAFGTTHKVPIGKKNKIYEIPFIQAKVVTGEIVIDKDKYSAYQFDLNNIRITATDSIGNTYHTFTNLEGQFELNLPENKYTLYFNEEYFSHQFTVVKNNLEIDLIDLDKYHATFVVKEKRRKINIKR